MTFLISFPLQFSSPLPTPNITFPIFHPSSNNTFPVFPLLLIHQYHSSYTQPRPPTPSHLQTSAIRHFLHTVNDIPSRITIFFRRHLGLHIMCSLHLISHDQLPIPVIPITNRYNSLTNLQSDAEFTSDIPNHNTKGQYQERDLRWRSATWSVFLIPSV